ncbi:unnamed protein product [Caenorhabditis angaria]|uniref:Cyclin N-terminal domain-containing protein n=1 Tax=Caenorhabditis angaria TaxID=860376 RepID=A0A9P1N0G7_9PELO|nr:unnamed protein product [Caenorhabditis angaria]
MRGSNTVRQALCVKNANVQAPVNQQSNKQMQNDTQQKIGAGGKMTRQIGRTNLLIESRKPRDFSPKIMANEENFEIFEDGGENSQEDNNMLHELDRKMEQQQKTEMKQEVVQNYPRKQFLMAREMSETLSVCDEMSTAPPSVMGFIDDDDFDRCSVISSATTSIRAEFSQINVKVEEYPKISKNPFQDSDADSKYAKTLAERERKLDEMLTCDEYFKDIFKYMADRGTKIRPSSKYMQKQADITVEMRSILIDWFNDVAIEYGLQQETLHLAVSLVDRVLSKFCVEKHRLQLVGTTALMIASKYEEIYPPELRDFAEITDSTCKADQILMMERYLLAQLNYVISAPTVSWFATCLAKRHGAKKKTRQLMEYLVDLAMLGYEFLKFRPSHVAAAALCFANVVLGEEEIWSGKVAQETEIRLNSFVVVLPHLYKAFTSASQGDTLSIYNKYSDAGYGSVSQLPAPQNVYVIPYEMMMSNCPEMLSFLPA